MKFPAIAHIVLHSFAGCSFAAAASIVDYPSVPESVLPPIGHTFFCQSYPRDCSHLEPSTLFHFLSEGALYENLDMVNKWVNSVIVPNRETNLEAVNTRWEVLPVSGNCHDFAVSKRHLLLRMGWPSYALLLAEVALKTGERHLVLVANFRGKRFVLDNLSPTPVPMQDTADYSWIRIESERHARYWVRVDGK